MSKYTIKRVTVGYGVTVLSTGPNGPGNVYKYYLEPTIDFEVPAEGTKQDLQDTLDSIAKEVLSMVQNSVRKKAASDKAARQKAQEDAAEQIRKTTVEHAKEQLQQFSDMTTPSITPEEVIGGGN